MATLGARHHSINRRLPLLIAIVLFVTVVAFSWTAYRQFEDVLLTATGERLRNSARTLEQMLSASTTRQRDQFLRTTGNVAIRRFLATGVGRDSAIAGLPAPASAAAATRGRYELRNAAGELVAELRRGPAPRASEWVEQQIAARTLSPGEVRVGPFRAAGDTAVSETIAAVAAPASGASTPMVAESAPRVAGYVVFISPVATQGDSTIRQLIGASSVVLVGAPGEGVWTNLRRVAPPPPANMMVDSVTIFDDSPRGAGVGAATAVRGTPWVLWIEQPRAVALAQASRLLMNLSLLAAFFIVTGAVVAWLLSRRITRPIVRLTEQAERLAANDAAPAGSAQRGDEVERLSEAFGRMSARVSESRERLEQRVSERTQRLEEAMEQLRRAQEQLVQKERLAILGQLSSAVGHELRNPLGVMTNALYVLDHSLRDAKPAVRDYLDLVKGQIVISERIVGDLLDTARTPTPRVEPVSLAELLATQVDRLRSITTSGINVRQDLPPDLPAAAIDPAHASQIVGNLLTNAIQAISENDHSEGTVWITGSAAVPGRIQLEVRDTGPGISTENVGRIFEPLFTTKARGLGLGLWVSRTLAIANQCELKVASPPGEGATFTLDMPAAPAAVER